MNNREQQFNKLLTLVVVIGGLLPLTESIIVTQMTRYGLILTSDTTLMIFFRLYPPLIIPAIFIITGIFMLARKPKSITFTAVYLTLSAIATILLQYIRFDV